jgi:hypothetical protein
MLYRSQVTLSSVPSAEPFDRGHIDLAEVNERITE